MAKYLKAVRSLYMFPHRCDVCGVVFDVGWAVKSDDGTEGDVCSRCLNKEEGR